MTESSTTGSAGWGDRLAAAHQALNDQLDTAVRAAVQAELGPSATLVEQLRAHCETVCLYVHGHHSAEDSLIFPHLVQTHPDLEGVIEGLRKDQKVVAGRLTELEDAIGAQNPATLNDQLRQLDQLLRSHFNEEEVQLAGILNALTGPVPWEQE